MADERETVRMWRVSKTVREMCVARGYNVSEQEINWDLDEFKTLFCQGGLSRVNRDLMAFAVARNTDATDTLAVFFPSEERVGVKDIRKFAEKMAQDGYKGAILVCQRNLTPSANKALSVLNSKYHFEVFEEADLVVNITKHVLVPKHEVLSPEEKKVLLERYRLKDTQLPRILQNDPVAKFYGLRKGQVVRITRPSETAGRYVTYRIAM
ncbi:RNA polymerase [Hyaloraphidium curvatum]|nr:RNA polymerase [Hyaloraphidium curvatum]